MRVDLMGPAFITPQHGKPWVSMSDFLCDIQLFCCSKFVSSVGLLKWIGYGEADTSSRQVVHRDFANTTALINISRSRTYNERLDFWCDLT